MEIKKIGSLEELKMFIRNIFGNEDSEEAKALIAQLEKELNAFLAEAENVPGLIVRDVLVKSPGIHQHRFKVMDGGKAVMSVSMLYDPALLTTIPDELVGTTFNSLIGICDAWFNELKKLIVGADAQTSRCKFVMWSVSELTTSLLLMTEHGLQQSKTLPTSPVEEDNADLENDMRLSGLMNKNISEIRLHFDESRKRILDKIGKKGLDG